VIRRRGREAEPRHEALAGLLLQHLGSETAWLEAIDALYAGRDRLIASARERLSEDDLLRLLSVLVIYLGRLGFETPERKERLFEAAQAMDVHVLPVHYGSPVPDTRALPGRLWEAPRSFGGALDLDVERQLAFLRSVSTHAPELATLEAEGISWDNLTISRTDASLYYCIVRELRPRRVIEVGGGHSTRVAASAAVQNGVTELVCIDPDPAPGLRELPGLARLVERPVQEADPGLFGGLGAGDILFVDGTHVVRVGSDVNYLLLEVVPALASGVLVHLHDVFTPWEYPEWWVREHQVFWSEQYLLEAFLLFNREFEVLCMTNQLGKDRPEAVRDALALPAGVAPGGSSAWLRRMVA
jgi:hypothetical protein